jgi:hypothetical protein
MSTFKLTDLEAPLDSVEFPSGAVHVVHRLDGFAMDLWRRYREQPIGDRDVGDLWILAGRLLPSASETEIKGLSWAAILGVIGIAGGNVAKLAEDAEKNASRAAEDPPSAPVIPSAPSSSASPA